MLQSLDFKNPQYTPVFAERQRRLLAIREKPALLRGAFEHYKNNPADFIDHWGMTVDPRNIEVGLPAAVPFILYPKQREWINYILRKWRAREPGITEKSRDMGISWLAVGLSATLSIFYHDMAIGFGSRKEEYVDRIGDPKSLFYKLRLFVSNLPIEFRGGWTLKNAPHMRCEFPDTKSVITGEAGDNIGRGDRKAIYFVDEAAHVERPQLVDASLSATTNCRQDLSSVNGMNNSFAARRFGGNIEVFTFSWRDDPRKDKTWYEKQCALLDPIVVAQEIDMNYNASAEGIVIPAYMVQSAIDAHIKLNLTPTGAKSMSLDIADRGIDKNAVCRRHGILIEGVEEWTGKQSDIFATTQKAFNIADAHGFSDFRYDADGMGAGVRGDARVVNEMRIGQGRPALKVFEFRGSGAVLYPTQPVPYANGRTNEDYFQNFKAQSWFGLRWRFMETHKAVNGQPYDPDGIISIPSDLPNRAKLCVELSQPVYKENLAGKMVIEKAPDGVASPNLSDSVMMAFARRVTPMVISDELLAATGR